MKKFLLIKSKSLLLLMLFITIVATQIPQQLQAQARSFSLMYSDNTNGDVQLFGNTLTAIFTNGIPDTAKMNGNRASGNSPFTNGFLNMQNIDVDGNIGDGVGTRNSSSSDLLLPPGTNIIKLARLYWGGKVTDTSYNLDVTANRSVKIRKGTSGPYQEYLAQQLDKIVSTSSDDTGLNASKLYQAYVDITSFVNANGGGTYTVGNIPVSIGDGRQVGNYGGWCMVVVYENPALDFNSIRLFDGFQQLWGYIGVPNATVTLTGLNVPSLPLSTSEARMGFMAWEGDASFNADSLKINNNLFSNAINPIDNMMNGTISTNAVHVTTKNPNYTNQMGIDIDQFDIGTGYNILPNANTVKIDFKSDLDMYLPGLMTFVVKMKEPSLSLIKTVVDANGNGTAEANELLTYTLKGKNIGIGNSFESLLTDTLPNSITYVPNSLKIIYSPGQSAGLQTDVSSDDNAEYIVNGQIKTVKFRLGVGANAINGGTLASLDSFEVEFKATINSPNQGNQLTQILNIARLQGTSDLAIIYFSEASATIKPPVINLPVLLTAFDARLSGNGYVKLNWITAQEINSHLFDIERSLDGVFFSKVGTVAAAGNSARQQTYHLTDNISTITNSIVYYRLRQVDMDGKFTFSKVVALRLKKVLDGFTVSPNPFRNLVNINIDWNYNENTTVKVFSMEGKELVSKTVQMNKGTNYVTINELYQLQAGNYLIQFNSGQGRVFKQVTKQ